MPDNNDTPAGATPAAAGATPAQTTPVSPVAGTTPAAPASPATGDPEGLGDAGKRAIDRMKAERDDARTAAKTASDELAALRAAGASESEKALTKARKEGGDEVLTRVQTQVRAARVESALLAAGVDTSLVDLAAQAAEFSGLKVTDDGKVEGLADAIAALKAARPALFRGAPAAGTADGGTRGAAGLTKEALASMKPEEINARWDEVQKTLSAK